MERTIYKFIFRYSKPEQVFILFITLASLPFYYVSLDIPKLIVNNVLTDIPEYIPEAMRDAATADSVPRYLELLGYQIGELERLTLLGIYCGLFLGLVLINGAFKWYINVYKGLLGERMLRRLRYQLFSRVLRFPLPHFRRVSSGELIPMITQEVEPLGGFVGDSVALPLYQGGLLATALVFIFMQDPFMGLAAIALYPVQGWIIPKLQRRVNLLGKDRVREVRKLSERIAETVHASQEIHANDTLRFELADFASRMQRIFEIRFDIYNKKFFIKFLNNFLAQLTPFFFYSIGGYLVIGGNLSLGGLVAVLAAYKDLQPPWKELLDFYQIKEDSKIKYDQVIAQFAPPGMREEELVFGDHEVKPFADGVSANNLQYAEDGESIIEGITLDIGLDSHVAIVGDAGSGKSDAALLIAHLIDNTGGTLRLGGENAQRLPEAVTGRRMGFVGASTHLISASLGDNLFYSLKHTPLKPREPEDPHERRALARFTAEAQRTGNTPEDPFADWIDYGAAGVADRAALTEAALAALDTADMTDDVYSFGLRGTLDPQARPDVAERLLEARRHLQEALDDPAYRGLVEPFDAQAYNNNATLGENLLFGTPVGDAFDLERLAENDYVMKILAQVGLVDELLDMGLEVARTMIELFADLPPDHEYFAQFAFISLDDLPDYQAIVRRAERDGVAALEAEERHRLLSLPFKLIPARHRLGLIDDAAMQARILEARKLFAEELPDDLKGSIEFFERTLYNAATSLQDNILFGKLAYGRAQAQAKVGVLISEVIEQLDLRPTVIEVGFDFQVGIGGSRLSPAQRQKLAIARAVLKHPDILILSEATAALDGAAQTTILRSMHREMKGRALIWVLHRPSQARGFDQVIVMKGGKIVERGKFDDLALGQTELADLIAAE